MSTRRLLLLSFALLLISTQMFASLIISAAVFIDSDEVTISPFQFRSKGHHDTTRSSQGPPWTPTGASETPTTAHIAVILCLYTPLVLVPFALLSSLLSAYGDADSGALWISAGCQAVSSALCLLGLAGFLGLHWAYTGPAAVTLSYYLCVLDTAELTVTTCLSVLLLRSLRGQTGVAEKHSLFSTL